MIAASEFARLFNGAHFAGPLDDANERRVAVEIVADRAARFFRQIAANGAWMQIFCDIANGKCQRHRIGALLSQYEISHALGGAPPDSGKLFEFANQALETISG